MTDIDRVVLSWKPPKRNYDAPTPIFIIIRNLKDDTQVATKQLDYGKPEDRVYLGKLSYWAMCNHHSVETFALSDIDLKTEER